MSVYHLRISYRSTIRRQRHASQFRQKTEGCLPVRVPFDQ
nr:unnamed protein product [Callosobruchus chinensis]